MIYSGDAFVDGPVAIGPVTTDSVHPELADAVASPSMDWVNRASSDESCMYFGITDRNELVGQILIHDIDPARGEGLIAYHLFRPAARGRGIGSAALRLLQGYIRQSNIVRTAVIITSRDNGVSQRLALKCGFVFQGAPREDPDGLVFAWVAQPEFAPQRSR